MYRRTASSPRAGWAAGALLLLREVRRRDLDPGVIERALTWALPAAAPGLALAVAVGRVGDLLITDHLGAPTSSRLALAYRVQAGFNLAPGFDPSPAVPPPPGVGCTEVGRFYAGCTYHLTPAYDLLGALVLFGVLMVLRHWGRYRAGTAISFWALWYGAQRLGVDFTRGIDERPALGLTGTQLLAIGVVSAGMVSLAVILTRHRGWGEDPGDAPSRGAPLRRTEWQTTSPGNSRGDSS